MFTTAKNKLFLVVGPSGTGKTTLVRKLVENNLVNEIKSTTTRPRRYGEAPDTYHFVTVEEFEVMANEGKLVESVVFGGNYYGVHEKDIRKPLIASDKPCVLIVDGHGMAAITDQYPYNTSVFFMEPAAPEEMDRRLANRPRDAQRIASDEEILEAKTALLLGVDHIEPAGTPEEVYDHFVAWMNDSN